MEKAMDRKQMTIVTSLMALFLMGSVAALGADKTKVKGMISGRRGEAIEVTTAQGKVTVVLAENTRIKDDRGLFGLEKEEKAATVLIPGLKVSVDGVADEQGLVVAKTITVDGDDLETSQMIQAGVEPTAEQVLEHEKQLLHHQQLIAANKEDIETNQQKIAEHKQKIEQNRSDIQSNTQRFTALAEYDTKGQATVKFATGSTKISKADMEQLKQL